ncbi:hypothetical protein BLS_005599 [Venturia inaequalis]|uniref:Type 1 phosphatases regulator n=1 Tax=Venturia inaequalis TaxID=5025 RepID=A0A8H3V8I1_VENIN|nr:hypothetical protein BLS_005599 [Venturia inaequalis]KAE9982339.1 hypothetical protein EG328_010999 [Venturia inaequalis]KAE9983933.1 hypothetical protein EG327_005297 [Venturia inaequalis]RDI85406.1 hypothetical protein Vi05172_g4567 [Venturia inaequalis]
MQASQTRTSTPQGGSTTTQAPRTAPTLVLRADSAQERHIQWSEDVVDNENMGKKSSKVCCIYHAPHNAEASSGDDSSSDSSSDSDSGDDGAARPVGGKKNRRGRRGQKHPHDHDHGKGDGESGDGNGKAKGTVRKRSPNAYEKQPTIKKKN